MPLIVLTIYEKLVAILNDRIKRLKKRAFDSSEIRTYEESSGAATIIIPRSDYRQGFPDRAAPLVFFALGFPIPMWYALKNLDWQYLTHGLSFWEIIIGMIGMIPLYLLVDVYFKLMRYELMGSDRITIDKQNNRIGFYPSVSFKSIIFYNLADENETTIEYAHIEMKDPLNILGFTIGKNKRLILIMNKKRISLAPNRLDHEKDIVYRYLNKHLREKEWISL